MTLLTFPDIDHAQDWYLTTRDGLAGLRLAVFGKADHLGLSKETLDDLFGITEQEWRQFYERNRDRHEIFATLALFAACEGGIRRDFAWRIRGGFGPMHHDRFRKLQQRSKRAHPGLAMILDVWKGVAKQNTWFLGSLNRLSNLFDQRNDLAHGRIGNAVAFAPVYAKLSQIREKWQDAVEDFRGY